MVKLSDGLKSEGARKFCERIRKEFRNGFWLLFNKSRAVGEVVNLHHSSLKNFLCKKLASAEEAEEGEEPSIRRTVRATYAVD